MLYKKIAILSLVGSLSLGAYQYSYSAKNGSTPTTTTKPIKSCCVEKKCTKGISVKAEEPSPKGCVFRTIFKEESAKGFIKYKTPENIKSSLDKNI